MRVILSISDSELKHTGTCESRRKGVILSISDSELKQKSNREKV